MMFRYDRLFPHASYGEGHIVVDLLTTSIISVLLSPHMHMYICVLYMNVQYVFTF